MDKLSLNKRQPYETLTGVDRRVYILGTGSIGKLVAHALKEGSEESVPPVTLLLHRPGLLKEFRERGRSITIKTNGVDETRSGFDLELALPQRQDLGKPFPVGLDHDKFDFMTSDETIHNLILTVKAPQTVSAITSIRHRLTSDSTILFMQNGMGMVEELNEKVFPDPNTRPNYMLGINSHGVHSMSSTAAVHAGHGIISLGVLPRSHAAPATEDSAVIDKDKSAASSKVLSKDGKRKVSTSNSSSTASGDIEWAPSSRYMIQQLTRVPVLAAVALSHEQLLMAQLEKLAVNCLINPLTVMLDSRNGDLLHNFALTRTMRLLLAEICTVFQALPELKSQTSIQTRFSPQRLEKMAVTVASKTANNISSMLADSRRGVQTEIEYINGYVVRRGEELGIKCVMNYMLMQMVIGKQQLIGREIENYTPVSQLTS